MALYNKLCMLVSVTVMLTMLWKKFNSSITPLSVITPIRAPPTLVNQGVPSIHVQGTNCAAIAASNTSALQDAYTFMASHSKKPIPAQQYIQWAASCPSFLSHRGYIRSSLTEDEAAFPLAFSILMYKDVEQFERLLRAIYRPQNVYCVHVDKKSSPEIQQAVKAISQCFDNVFMSSIQRDVHYAGFTTLEPEILCMRDLWKHKTWKYFINLTGQEWPLKTNWYLVQTLKLLNGGNIIEGFFKRRRKFYYAKRWKMKPQFPGPISLVKGAVHVLVSRAYVDYVLHNQTAIAFLSWLNGTSIPDETYFSSLYFSPQAGVPGAYTGPRNKRVSPISRYKLWSYIKKGKASCHGRVSHSICILGVGDVRNLVRQRRALFANKFHLDFQPLGLDCMEQLLFERIRQEASGHQTFSAALYNRHPNFKYHL